jgi:hypothetical protein
VLIPAREILATGTWPGTPTTTFTEADLDQMVAAFNALDMSGKVPLKLGHDGPEDPTSQYAMGWVQRIYREGKKLFADFDVPDRVASIIKEKFLKFVSVEVYKDVQAFNRRIPFVLSAVALLGTDPPAVGVLKDLLSFSTRKTSLKFGAKVSLSKRDFSTQEESKMDEKEFAEMLKKHAPSIIEGEVKKATDPLKAQLAASEERATNAEKATKEQAVKFKREQIDARFNAAIECGALEPSKRESYTKMTKYDKDDARALEVDLKDVDDFIKDNSKEPTKLNAKKQTKEGSGGDEPTHAKTNDLEVTRRAVARCIEMKQDPTKYECVVNATRHVLSADKKLAAAYMREPGGEFKVEEAK